MRMSVGLYTNVHISFTANSQKLETTEMSISRGLDKQTVVYPYNELPLSSKKERTMTHATTWEESQNDYVE